MFVFSSNKKYKMIFCLIVTHISATHPPQAGSKVWIPPVPLTVIPTRVWSERLKWSLTSPPPTPTCPYTTPRPGAPSSWPSLSLIHLAPQRTTEEHRKIDENHNIILEKENKDEYELDKALYNKVLKRIRDKGKRMFDLLNKSGEKYKSSGTWIEGGFILAFLHF